MSSEKTTQYAYGGGIVVSFYKTEEVLEEIYIYDMNTIMVSQEDSIIKYITETNLLEYFSELIGSLS